MKKLFAILIACTTLISCVSCSSDSKESNADSGADTTVAGTTASDDNGTTAPNGTAAPADSTNDVQTDTPNEKVKTLYKWTFDDEDESLEYWTPSENIISCEIENGVLNITLDENDVDPYYMSEIIEDDVFTEDIKTITLKVKNCTSFGQGAIYYCTENMTFYEGNSFIKFSYENTGENADWEIVTINIAEIADTLPNWDGCITRLRLDCINNASGGNFYVDYISING